MTTSYQNYWNKKKRNQAKLNGAMFTLTFVFIIWALVYCSQFHNEVYVRETQIITQATTTPHTPSKEEIIELIKKHFPVNGDTMVRIAKAESGLKVKAINYNCYYNVDETIVYETRVKGSHGASCHKGHEKYSFGVDCSILQFHYRGLKQCPDIPLEKHMEMSAELSKVCGLNCWVAYSNGSYKKY